MQVTSLGSKKVMLEPVNPLDLDNVPNVEVKPLPIGLRHECFGTGKTYQVIINGNLSEKMGRLLAVLRYIIRLLRA
jgi:hypothetical protein